MRWVKHVAEGAVEGADCVHGDRVAVKSNFRET